MKKCKVLVTGGAGYIGSSCVKLLVKRGFDVTVFDNLEYGYKHNVDPKAKLIVGDLREYRSILDAMRKVVPDAVIHFAAYALVGESCKDPLKYYNNNVTGGINLLMAMENVGCERIIFSSTCATYGIPNEGAIPSLANDGTISEQTPQKPINPYGSSKHIFEQIIKQYAEHKPLKYTIFRYFNACGANGNLGEEHIPETHLIPNVVQTALGLKKCLEIYGDDYDTPDGTCIRDYIHIKDLADAHVKALENDVYGQMNLGTGHGTSNKEIVDAVKNEMHLNFKVKYADRRPGDPDKLVANPSFAMKVLNWKPKYSTLKNILDDAIDFQMNKGKI